MAFSTPSGRSAAFTLIELLIVVAIIAILAAIAVPNFLEAQVRAKVSRCLGDMRNVSIAIESYRIDWPIYPEIFPEIPPGSGARVHITYTECLSRLTTPVSYMTSIPLDPFAKGAYFDGVVLDTAYIYYDKRSTEPWADQSGWTDYWINCHGDPAGNAKWVLESLGPDRLMNWQVPVWPQNIAYDSSNGTVSVGEIFFWGPGLGTGFGR